MAGRGIKGHIAVCSTTLLLILNLIVLAGGVASVVILFLIEHQPSRAGWLIVIAGAFTVASGLIGLCSSTRRGCFTLQLVLLAFSVIGLLATAFAIFFRVTQVRNALDKPFYNPSTTKTLLRVLGAVAFCTGCVQVAVLTLGICVNCCDLNDYYEDIEMTRSMNAKEAKEVEKRAARREESKSVQLAEQMREKYGKWTDKSAAKK
ncbi:uncharacterized protein [Physcomitrium patens]|uniref:Uncharacterized protein n=1 Tax=Physcomitrium patens TaxID=3218 RepID=A9SLX5_PHYPA|nr:uncharacterized protein LOC112275339 [Physcomitrium patens]XP_024361400.1 uncharacterized protein LOC112275339 [Physcomitrium patens]XP_024361401.1 uncharacterized protein LOC112275339 [Physcomitrium patens]XP_024361402.1 uncharacterized protein LOC112275339 [Physcomitrium patens]PNR31032.1 hypothetical protein PHYPA_027348 [Physcomitrium patens]|eukprot:XP_024361398.1 uncharacterized protein LOC112275339 [Physcomitrella patens]